MAESVGHREVSLWLSVADANALCARDHSDPKTAAPSCGPTDLSTLEFWHCLPLVGSLVVPLELHTKGTWTEGVSL